MTERTYLALMAEHAQDAHTLIDVLPGHEFRVVAINPAGMKLGGWRDEEIIGKRIEDMLSFDEAGRALAQLIQVVRSREPLVYEAVHTLPSGVRTLEFTLLPIEDQGTVARVLVVSRDITNRANLLEERRRAEEQLRRREAQLAEAQRLAQVGSFEYDIHADAFRGSDELHRIYGRAASTLDPGLNAFVQCVHPDDRETTETVMRRAIDERTRFSLDHRIVRPDGSIHTLRTQGRVLLDASGEPTKLVGVSLDITEQAQVEHALHDSEERFRSFLKFAPDAVLVADATGAITVVNEQLEHLFGYGRDEILGHSVEMLLPERVRDRHREHRAGYLQNPVTRPMGAGLALFGRRKDGTEFPVDISLSSVRVHDGIVVTAYIRDITERANVEESARKLREEALMRRQALEINDNVVQGLATAVFALEIGDVRKALQAIQSTMNASRQMMADLLQQPSAGGLEAGTLVRARPAEVLEPVEERRAEEPAHVADPIRVLVADDTADIRMVIRYTLSRRKGFDIVAEAADGAEAIRLAETTQPDVAVIDLAMPVMDGLQAIPEIRRVAPRARIVVLSGYGAAQMAAQALHAGADAYLEKGHAANRLIALVRQLCPEKADVQDLPSPPLLHGARAVVEPSDATELLLSTYLHELRTPLTVIEGVSSTLRDRIDALPSAVVNEFLESLQRNSQQMRALIDAFSDARKVGAGVLQLLVEPVDVGTLIRQTLTDLVGLTRDHPVSATLPDLLITTLDPIRIRQVLMNVMSNAAKFSDPGAPIEVEVTTGGGNVEIGITDHGPGIPPERTERLFERFAHLGMQRKGMGLGLYISKGIAQAHGGDLILQRSDERGSTFVLRLPLKQPVRNQV